MSGHVRGGLPAFGPRCHIPSLGPRPGPQHCAPAGAQGTTAHHRRTMLTARELRGPDGFPAGRNTETGAKGCTRVGQGQCPWQRGQEKQGQEVGRSQRLHVRGPSAAEERLERGQPQAPPWCERVPWPLPARHSPTPCTRTAAAAASVARVPINLAAALQPGGAEADL